MDNIFLEFYFLMTNIQWAFPEFFLKGTVVNQPCIFLYVGHNYVCTVQSCYACLQFLFALIPMEWGIVFAFIKTSQFYHIKFHNLNIILVIIISLSCLCS